MSAPSRCAADDDEDGLKLLELTICCECNYPRLLPPAELTRSPDAALHTICTLLTLLAHNLHILQSAKHASHTLLTHYLHTTNALLTRSPDAALHTICLHNTHTMCTKSAQYSHYSHTISTLLAHNKHTNHTTCT